jgi:DNA-binding NarL/FixJ family response regulator
MTTAVTHPDMPKARILIVDDHPIFRQGIGQLIDGQEDMLCCGEAEDLKSTLRAIPEKKPDLILVDMRLANEDGLDLIKAVKVDHPDMPMLAISQFDETVYAERVLRAGGSGYLMKEEAAEEVLSAIRTVLKGELYVTRKMAVLVLHKLLEQPNNSQHGDVASLSDRELQVFSLLGGGLSTRKIAIKLGVSFKTIESHRENIKRKLGIADAASLLRHAADWARSQPNGAPAPR